MEFAVRIGQLKSYRSFRTKSVRGKASSFYFYILKRIVINSINKTKVTIGRSKIRKVSVEDFPI